jgi:NADH:ubiquinone oxidoreductase subunit 5 (subunit L)/multisubunit Na+/H+ antiporter MnhA subunit
LAAIFTATLVSLAGIPLTAGFIGKVFVLLAGIQSALWPLVILLVLTSALGLVYYLRIVVAIYGALPPRETAHDPLPVPTFGHPDSLADSRPEGARFRRTDGPPEVRYWSAMFSEMIQWL